MDGFIPKIIGHNVTRALFKKIGLCSLVTAYVVRLKTWSDMDKHSRYMINSIAMPYVTLLCKNNSPYPSAYLVAWQRQLLFNQKTKSKDYQSHLSPRDQRQPCVLLIT